MNSLFSKRALEPYVIAEIGVNHGGDLDRAKRQIRLAKLGGASCVKFQTYKAGTLASRFSPSYWDLSEEPTTSQYELFSKYDGFGQEEYEELARFSGTLNIDFASTPFDLASVDFLANLVPFFKVASADLTNLPLLRKVASKGLPVILSTGASHLWEIASAVEILEQAGAPEVVLLHCILNYPTLFTNANLSMIESLQVAFPSMEVGYSDHTKADESLSALEVAFSLGATVLEKHFTDNPDEGGNDHYHAMTQVQLSLFLERCETRLKLLGTASTKKPLLSEEVARANARRSIHAAVEIKKGELFSPDNLICKRPGGGIDPLHWDLLIGKVSGRKIMSDEKVSMLDLVGDLAADVRQ